MLTPEEERSVRAMIWLMEMRQTEVAHQDEVKISMFPNQFFLLLRALKLLLEEETI